MTSAKSVVLSGLVLCCAAALAAPPEWTLALQAWTLNKKTFAETVAIAAELGLKAIEGFPGQVIGDGSDQKLVYTMDSASRDKVRQILQRHGVRWVNYGVVTVKGEAEWRKLFEFAKEMGIETLVSEPAENDLDMISKLCDEFKIRVAIHNHPEPSRYWNPDTVLKAVENRSPLMGACADTGHWLRSNLEPLDCVKKLRGRIISLHLKDLPEKGVKSVRDVPWGTGVGNLDQVLKELHLQGFKGVVSIEYENWGPDQMDSIRKCIQWFRAWSP